MIRLLILIGYFADAVYTERYMGLPTDNPDGYKVKSQLYHLNLHTAFLCVTPFLISIERQRDRKSQEL